MIGSRIGYKIIAAAGVTIFVTLVLATLFHADRQEAALLDQAEANTRKMVETVDRSIQTIMLAGYADIAQALARELKEIPNVASFDILRVDGSEAFRDNKTILEVNRIHGEEEFLPREVEEHVQTMPADDADLMKAIETEDITSTYFRGSSGESMLMFLSPILNGEDCHDCHGDDHRVRGVVRLTMSLDFVERSIARTQNTSFLLYILTAGLALAIIGAYVWRSVVAPVRLVTGAMTSVAKGDLAQRVPVLGSDELSVMAGNFNRMIERLLSTQTGLQDEQNKLTTIIESAREGIIASNSAGEIVLVNLAAERLLAKSRDTIIAGGMDQLLDNPDTMHRAFESEQIELRYADKILSIYGAVISHESHLLGSAALIRDVTRERVLEDTLRDQFTELQQAQETIKQQSARMAQDLELGHDIQQGLLTKEFFTAEDDLGVALHAALYPATEVAGDFYEFFFVDDEHLCFCVGDVAGKGVASALFMAITKALIKSRASSDLSPGSIFTHVNAELEMRNESFMFVTAFLGVLNIRSGKLVYSNAGHNPSYILASTGDMTLLEGTQGAALGVLPEIAYAEESMQLQRGDKVVVYTDGITEAIDVNEQLFGAERLADTLRKHQQSSCMDLTENIVEAVNTYARAAAQFDDITILALEYLNEPVGASDNWFELRVANEMARIEDVLAWVDQAGEDAMLPTDERRDMQLVLDEILNNIISYGFTDQGTHEIAVQLHVLADRATLTILDDGQEFDPASREPVDITRSLDEREIGGLGLHLVSNVMDEISYYRSGGRNHLTLTRYRCPSNDDVDHGQD